MSSTRRAAEPTRVARFCHLVILAAACRLCLVLAACHCSPAALHILAVLPIAAAVAVVWASIAAAICCRCRITVYCRAAAARAAKAVQLGQQPVQEVADRGVVSGGGNRAALQASLLHVKASAQCNVWRVKDSR